MDIAGAHDENDDAISLHVNLPQNKRPRFDESIVQHSEQLPIKDDFEMLKIAQLEVEQLFTAGVHQ